MRQDRINGKIGEKDRDGKRHHKRKMRHAGTTYLMCTKGQQFQNGNYVPEFCVVLSNVLLCCCVRVCMYVICGGRAVNTWEDCAKETRKKRGGERRKVQVAPTRTKENGGGKVKKK